MPFSFSPPFSLPPSPGSNPPEAKKESGMDRPLFFPPFPFLLEKAEEGAK